VLQSGGKDVNCVVGTQTEEGRIVPVSQDQLGDKRTQRDMKSAVLFRKPTLCAHAEKLKNSRLCWEISGNLLLKKGKVNAGLN
jgi:hypothetical protein